jgi:excisionase family DNA binding protein
VPKDTVREHISRGGRRYAKVAEAADYMHLNPYTVRAMLRDGRLTPYKLGNRIWRVDLNEVDKLMAAGGAA